MSSHEENEPVLFKTPKLIRTRSSALNALRSPRNELLSCNTAQMHEREEDSA